MADGNTHHFNRAALVLTLLGVSVLGSGCSIPERTSVQLEPLHGPAAPVMLDVYDRSIQQDVYSKQGSGALEPVSPLESVDTLRDLKP